MIKKLAMALPLMTLAVTVTSCGGTSNTNISITTEKTSETRIISPENVVITETLTTIENKLIAGQQFLPAEGDVNLLVIPVEIPGYEFIDINNDGEDDKEKVKNDINTLFNGVENLRNESVSSFYKKSSFGKLNLTASVTDWFSINNDSDLNYINGAAIEADDTYDIVNAAVEWAKNDQNINLTNYDYDKDGYIDGVWLIYSANNYQNGGPQTDSSNFFAYTSWGNTEISDVIEPSVSNPIYNLFGWASYDFMYRDGDFENVDSHAYIHEMGHFFGLNDYYTENYSYNPIGKADLMDGNICDLNNYSKMLIGWTKPYIVTGNAEINLKSMQNLNNFIVIPGDETEITNNEFDPFSEYILIEYYTNEGLNNYSSHTYVGSSPLSPKEKGVRIYHVDNRKFLLDTTDMFNISCKEYKNETLDETHQLVLPITNDRSPNIYNYYYNLDVNVNLFDEIRLIEARNIDTFSSGGYQTSKSFFKENDVFSMTEYGDAFFSFNKLNNRQTFSYEIKIGGLK